MFDPRRKRPKVGGPAAGFTGGKLHGTGVGMGARQFKNNNDVDDGAVAGPSGMATHGIWNNQNMLFPTQMPKQEIKPEPGDSPQHMYTNTLPVMHQMPHTSPVPERSPSHLAPSPGMQGGPISPHDGSITPSPPVYTPLQAPINQQYYQSNMATMGSRHQQQQQPQNNNNNNNTNQGGPMAGSVSLFEPSLMQAWEQQNGLEGLHVGHFEMINNDASMGMLPASLIMQGIGGNLSHINNNNNNNQSNSAIPSMNSEINFNRLSELDLDRLPEINSSEIRAILVPNSSLPPVSQGQASSLQQQQQQLQQLQQQQELQQLQQQLQPHDNDEELTDSFNRLSTND
ncbi:myb-like protein AA [Anopheles aquasalis]|uniref:myb-like protein AA n=1 Tax=Anopheles aquasalis TaxID=42839 RepID=UPI00215B3346|nr:myb-like protein AA [Anopheles aquasalis]